jgi:hypothetical protein
MNFHLFTAADVYLPEGRHPIIPNIPTFHHSRCERSEPKSYPLTKRRNGCKM